MNISPPNSNSEFKSILDNQDLSRAEKAGKIFSLIKPGINPRLSTEQAGLTKQDQEWILDYIKHFAEQSESIRSDIESFFCRHLTSEAEKANYLYYSKKDLAHKALNKTGLWPDFLQGNTQILSLFSFILDLSEYQEGQRDNVEVAKMLRTIKETYTHERAFSILREHSDIGFQREVLEALSEQLVARVDSLQQGEHLVLTGGIFKKHAMLFEIECISNVPEKKYRFKIINSGLGIQHHYTHFWSELGHEARFKSFVIDQVSQKGFTKEFFCQLMGPNVFKPQRLSFFAQLIKALVAFFKGDVEINQIYQAGHGLIKTGEGQRLYKDLIKHRPQNNGVCPHKILTFWAKEALREENDQFKLFSHQRALARLLAACVDKNPSVPSFFKRLKNFFTDQISAEDLYALGKQRFERRVKKYSKKKKCAVDSN